MALIKRDGETLAWSRHAAVTPAASLREKLTAAEFLVTYGLYDEADAAIDAVHARMRARGVAGGSQTAKLMERLAAVSRKFREANLAPKLRKLGNLGPQLLDAKQEALLSTAKGSRTLLVVFSTMYSDFWVSYPVLHCLLPTETVSVLYLKDPREMMYLCGLTTYGQTFAAMIEGIRSVARDLEISDIRIVAFSSGGYAALLAASMLGANGYLGLSIRTDLSPSSPLPTDRYVMREDFRRAAEAYLLDLKPILVERATPKRGVLYYGKLAKIDAEHARHLADLPNFVIKEVPGTWHNTVISLLADGTFEGIVRNFLR